MFAEAFAFTDGRVGGKGYEQSGQRAHDQIEPIGAVDGSVNHRYGKACHDPSAAQPEA